MQVQVTPMPMPGAHSHDATWASEAPSACAAWNTITAELVKPTSTVTKPAATDDAMSRSQEPRSASASGGVALTRSRLFARGNHYQQCRAQHEAIDRERGEAMGLDVDQQPFHRDERGNG